MDIASSRPRLHSSLTQIASPLLLGLLILSGCSLGPVSQTQIAGKVLGVNIVEREHGRTVMVPLRATVTCNGSSATAGADGTFQLSASTASSYHCTVRAPLYAPLTATVTGSGTSVSISFAAATAGCTKQRHSATVICGALSPAPGTLSGTVINPPTDTALAHTTVRCWTTNPSLWNNGEPPAAAVTTTDSYGRYSLKLPVDPYACLIGTTGPSYHTVVAPGIVTSLNMTTCQPQCPAFSYHRGHVLHSFVAYVIFWLPSGATFEPGGSNARFEALVRRYFTDVGGSSLYAVATQYWDSTGPIISLSSLGGTWVDTTPYPHAGTQSDPLLDSDIQQQVLQAMATNHWTAGLTHEFFVVTGYGVEECNTASGTAYCTFPNAQSPFCGYHATLNSDNSTAYAFIADNSGCASLPASDPYNSPNNDPTADGVLSTFSHEQFETITDPTGTGWYNGSPDTGEMADLCTTDYGTIQPDGSNVSLNGHPYLLQSEWSNASNACVLSLVSP